jgi:MoxR-like ATPase
MSKPTWSAMLKSLVDSKSFPYAIHRILLWGPPGTGKSTWAQHVFSPERVERVTIHGDLAPDDLVACRDLVVRNGASATVWSDGPAVRAMKLGKVLVLDEIDQHSPQIRCLLHSVCDDLDTARITLPNGDIVRPAKGFGIVATTNASPDALPEALLDRFVAVYCGDPAEGTLKTLPKGMAEVLKSHYSGRDRMEWQPAISVRRMLMLASLAAKLPMECAADLVYGDAGRDIANMIAVQRGVA